MALTARQLAFIDKYFECNLNATEAARQMGYKHPQVQGPRMLSNVREIRDTINQKLTEMHMGADEVLARLTEQARGIQGDYLTEQGKIDFKKLKEDGKGYLVQGLKPTKFGTEVQFPSSQTALLNIGKQHGLFSDRHIIETKVEKELDSILATLEETLSPDDFQRIVARLTSGQTSSPEVGSEETE
jgi:phage terminase small subunit